MVVREKCLVFSFKVIFLAPRALGTSLALDLAALATRIAVAGRTSSLTRFYDKGLSIKHEHVLFDL